MDSFAEVLFPARLAFGSTGGVERRTEVVQLASGFERRWTPRAHGRRRFLIGQGVRSLEEAAELRPFSRRGAVGCRPSASATSPTPPPPRRARR